MSLTTTEPRKVLERLRRARRVLVVGHRNPDGDSLGSAIGFAELAEKLGIDAVLHNRDEAGAGLCELPGANRVTSGETLPEDFPAAYDMVVTMECPGLDRTGFEEELTRLPILNIDHHKANGFFGAVNFIDEDSPAAGEMIWRLFEVAPVSPSPDAATALFAALSTDTGDFRYSNATGRAFRAAAQMVEWGADPTRVAELVHGRRSLGSVRLLGEALATLELSDDGRIAVISVDQTAFARAAATAADTDGIVNVPRSIAGVDVVVFVKESDGGSVRVSLRSKGDIDVRSIAASYGGGGHTNAAGCSIEQSLADARRELFARCVSLLENG
jgi:phosphoesterase RecJ-like protein